MTIADRILRLAEFARLSQAAYLEEPAVRAALRLDGWALLRWLDAGTTQGFVASRYDGGDVAVVFRGTTGEDVLTDLRAHKVSHGWGSWPKGRVHAGFKAALDPVWSQLSAVLLDLRRLRPRGIAVWFAGHSLGGALATLAAARVRTEMLCPVAGLVTFGCPRVGDLDFVEDLSRELEGRVWRIVNNSDIVPRLLCLTYLHLGVALYLCRRGTLIEGPGLWFVIWDMLLGRIAARLYNPLRWKTDGLHDHSIDEYRRVLMALAEGRVS